MNENEQAITWDLTYTVDGQERTLHSAADVRKFLSDYGNFYEFILARLDQKSNPHNTVYSWAAQLAMAEKTVDSAIADKRNIANVSRWLRQDHAKLPIHTSKDAHTIKRIWDEAGTDAGVGAAIIASGEAANQPFTNDPIWNHREMAGGAIKFLAADQSIDVSAAKDLEGALSRTQSDFTGIFKEVEDQAREQLDEIGKSLEQFEKQDTESTKKLISSLKKLRRRDRTRIRKAIESIRNTEKTYIEHMHLRAPRKYWDDKAIKHGGRIKIFAGVTGAWFVLGGLVTGLSIWCIFQTSITYALTWPDTVKIPILIFSSLGALGLLITTIFFWVARLLVRLMLSEIHLNMDANERVVMVESYLALLHDGAVADDQRTIILSALFRPTQDGIVKDDAAADPNIIGLLRQQLPKGAS